MMYLIATSLLWAFSFGLIKGRLGGLDPDFVAFARLGISALVFLPFLRTRSLAVPIITRLIGVGGIQFGLMYVLYIRAYDYLAAHEVALFTVLTPLYITLLSRSSTKSKAWIAAALACAGAAAISWEPLGSDDVWIGFFLVQCANLCFAFGQLAYKRLSLTGQRPHQSSFGWMFIGGVLVAGLSAGLFTPWGELTVSGEQGLTLLYLGLLPSGVGFFLWNVGATRVSEQVLAVMNNIKVPLGVVVSLSFFGEKAEIVPLLIGSLCLIAALLYVRRS